MNYENVLKARKELLERIEKEEQQKHELELNLLKINQIFGNDCLDIFKKYGTKAAITDFSILLGGYVDNDFFVDDINKLSNRTGWYWTKAECNKSGSARAADCDGSDDWHDVNLRVGGVRPAIAFSSISKICLNEVSENGLIEVEYGEYPQWACSNKLSEELEELYKKEILNKTGKKYTTDSRNYSKWNMDFKLQEHIEYEYKGKKYVRVIVDGNSSGEKLSSGKRCKFGEYIWISVSPIKWLVDKEKDIAITKNIIVSGIQFNIESIYDGTNFNEMNIKKFMDKYLSKDIVSSKAYNSKIEIKEETFESLREEARRKLREILGDDFNQIINNSEDNYQKQLKNK